MTAEEMHIWHQIVKSDWVTSVLIIMSFLMQSHKAFHQAVLIDPDPVIFQKWLFSHDDDSNALKIYKPANFDYPLGWGRPGMKFQQNGCFVLYEFAPNDQQIQIHCDWKSLSKRVLEITFPYGERDNYQIEIKELKLQILKLKKL
jgi:hypothetical protein